MIRAGEHPSKRAVPREERRDAKTRGLRRVGVRASDLYRVVTSPLRSLPDFLIIGAQKCGTTSLYRYLEEHPGVVPARHKEMHFFDTKRHLGGRFLYRAFFPTRVRKRRAERAGAFRTVTGESSPSYLFFPSVPGRVWRMVPNARLVVLLRDPVDRAYSHYHHMTSRGCETLPFEEAIARDPGRPEGAKERALSGTRHEDASYTLGTYLSRGVYVDQLETWRKFFPEEQLLVLKSEDLYQDPSAVVGRTLDFLGLPVVEPEGGYGKHNEGDYAGEMDPATRRRLTDYFRPHNERLYEYLGKDFGWDR